MTARLLVGDVRERLADLPDGSVDLVLTSPPFLALRSYLPSDHPAKVREIGSEPTPAAYLDTMLELSAEWRRVLAPHGSLVVELGDTYAGSGGSGGDYHEGGEREGQTAPLGSARTAREHNAAAWPLAKSLTGIPTLYTWSLVYGRNLLGGQASPAGKWRARNLVPWVRSAPPVGALGDKFRPATSFITVACTSAQRWFDLDAVRKPASPNTHARVGKGSEPRYDLPSQQRDGNWHTLAATNSDPAAGAPPLDWVLCNPRGYEGSHYAVWPPELLGRFVESMCPRRVCATCGSPSRRETVTTRPVEPDDSTRRKHANGVAPAPGRQGRPPEVGWETTTTTTGWTSCGCLGADGIRLDGYHSGPGWRPGHVLDPFGGTGTTALVATGMARDCTLIDLDERNVGLARERLGMFLDVSETPA